MSGHSKWSSIKHKKGAIDAKRGQLFTKLAREVTMAARAGGGDPSMNARLRLAILKAKEANMPGDNIERATKRGAGTDEAFNLEEITYEGYGPGGTAVIVEAVTDNRNRTVADIRNAFSRGGGNLAESGAVAWQFELRGIIAIDASKADIDEIQLAAIDAGAEDTSAEEGTVEVYTQPTEMTEVRTALEGAGYTVESAEIAPLPKALIDLDEKAALAALKLLERLDDLDDVQRVFSNANFPAELVEAACRLIDRAGRASGPDGRIEGWSRVLGVDPGLAVTGYGLVEGDGTTARIIATGIIKTKPRWTKAERLAHIFEGLGALIEEHTPDTLAVELQFVAENVRSAMTIGEARSAAILAAASRGLPVHEYLPSAIKESVAGHGGAPKEQVRQMVAVHLGVPLDDLPASLDATDALAVALTRLADLRLEAALARRA